MKSTINYLDEAKEKLGIESDYAMAKWLGVGRAAVSNWRVKRNFIDDYAAAKIAQALGVEPMEIIAAANAEREKGDKKEFWENFYKRLGGIAASIFFAVNLIMTPTPSQAAPMLNADGDAVYIMLNRRHN